jgi:WD40 repeat protein
VQVMPLAEFESDLHSCCAAFHPDGTSLFVSFADGSLRCIDLAQLSITWSSSRHSCPVVGMACSRDGKSVLSASQDGKVAVTAASGEAVLLSRGLLGCLQGAPLDCIALISPGSSMLAAAWGNGFAVATVPWSGGGLQVVCEHRIPMTDTTAQVRKPPNAWMTPVQCSIGQSENQLPATGDALLSKREP